MCLSVTKLSLPSSSSYCSPHWHCRHGRSNTLITPIARGCSTKPTFKLKCEAFFEFEFRLGAHCKLIDWHTTDKMCCSAEPWQMPKDPFHQFNISCHIVPVASTITTLQRSLQINSSIDVTHLRNSLQSKKSVSTLPCFNFFVAISQKLKVKSAFCHRKWPLYWTRR